MSEMITLLVHGAFYRGDTIERRLLTAEKNENLYTVLKRGGLYLHDCSGNGSCGKCKVRFVKGAPLPSAGERALLSVEELRAGVRLACRHLVTGNAELVLETEAAVFPDVVGVLPDSDRINIAGDETAELISDASNPVFAAVDIGTTTVAMRGMCGGKEVGSYAALNPQRSYGADVVSRIGAGMQGHAEEMRGQIISCLEEGLKSIAQQCGRVPSYMVIAANTTMVHLLCKDPLEPLSAFPFKPVNIKTQQIVVAGIPAYIICGISAFVGGDIVSGMAAMGLHKASDLQLFIDLGTNGEIVLGNKENFLCTAAAAGPAFEGNVSADLMGADLVRIAAGLLEEGLMDAHGLLQEPYFSKGIDRGGAHITQESIRELQKAKAAIRTGVELLLERYGAAPQEVSFVRLAGGFGYYLNPEAALRIGLLPNAFEGKIKAVGNTALQGACMLGSMIENGGMDALLACTEQLAHHSVYLNLAMQVSFEKKYISNLDFPS